MCGLAGGALGPKRRRRAELEGIAEVFTDLLVLNESRGRDASGVALVDRDGSHMLVKRAVPASLLVEFPVYDAVLDEITNRTTALLGHTRFPTRGTVANPLNNQPLRRGRTLGTHNGTIANAEELGYGKIAAVDSEVLVLAAECSNSLAEFVRRIGEMTGDLAGAIAKLDDPTRVQLLRGNKPLAICYHPRWEATFWSSLAGHLEETVGPAREIGWMTGVTLRDGRPVRKYRLELGEEPEHEPIWWPGHAATRRFAIN